MLNSLTLKVGDPVAVDGTLFVVSNDELTQNLAVSDARNQVQYAQQQINKMTVISPINGIIVAENNSNGDAVQTNKAVLSIMDPSSMKIKVAIDELDIAKVKQGQKAEIRFDAIKNKVYAGTVEVIAQTGTSSNNVTTYDVTVALSDSANVKLGMNANVNILINSKNDALTIPAEALIERNGNKYVMIPASTSTPGSNTSAKIPSQ